MQNLKTQSVNQGFGKYGNYTSRLVAGTILKTSLLI